MMWKVATYGLSLLAVSPVSAAVPTAVLPWTSVDAALEMSSEGAQCMAYFAAARQCTLNTGRPDVAGKLMTAITTANELSTVFGKAAGMRDEAIIAQMKLATGNVMGDLQGSCANMAIPTDRYAKVCKALLDDPKERAQTLANGPSSWP